MVAPILPHTCISVARQGKIRSGGISRLDASFMCSAEAVSIIKPAREAALEICNVRALELLLIEPDKSTVALARAVPVIWRMAPPGCVPFWEG